MKHLASILTTFVLLFLCTSYGLTQTSQTVTDASEIDQIHNLILDSNYNQLKMHFKNGGNVNATDEVGNTPLHFAAKVGDLKIVKLLVRQGATLDQANETGTTPLMMTAKYNNATIANYLLDNGANATLHNKSGFTAKKFAEIYKHNRVLRQLP